MSRLALHWQILGGMLVGAAIGLALNCQTGVLLAPTRQGARMLGLPSLSQRFQRPGPAGRGVMVDGGLAREIQVPSVS